MRRKYIYFLGLTVFSIGFIPSSRAEDSPDHKASVRHCPGALGTAPPAGFDFKAVTALSGNRPKVLQAMKDSFGHFRNAIVALNDADADKPQEMFNR
jgi:hypothetical protein